jgi:CBS-domain-containing membrane protein
MSVGVATCPPETPAVELARRILQGDAEVYIVLEEGNAAGVVGPEELARAYAHTGLEGLTARQVMHEDVLQAPPDIPLAAAAQLMLDNHRREVFMMHHAGGVEYPAGVLTLRHLLRHMAAQSADELKDLGIAAQRKTPLEAFFQRRDAARAAVQKSKKP